MPVITWRDAEGIETSLDVAAGTNLMKAAVSVGIRGICGDCGGALACATCHVVPVDTWAARVGAPGPMEDEMLDMIDGERQPASRLSCQIVVSDEFDGLVLWVPQS